MRRLNSMDNLFLKQENRTQPQHTIKAVVLDPAAAHQPLTFDAVRAGSRPGGEGRAVALATAVATPGRPTLVD